jgi:penicillin-binding protein 1A
MDETTNNSQQFFPTYNLDLASRDVGMREYESAAQTLMSEERLFATATAILVATVGIISTILYSKTNDSSIIDILKLNDIELYIIMLFLLTFFSFSSIIYFAALNRSIVNASRKIIILRRMLGLSYGSIRLVLPTDRIEGANNPHAIPMFHGWASYKSIPFFIVAILSSIFVYLVTRASESSFIFFIMTLANLQFARSIICDSIIVVSLWFITLCIVYRSCLMDHYEDWRLVLTTLVSKILRQPMVDNVEYVLYRSNLAVCEAKRLNVNLSDFYSLLIFVEDKNFYKHHGVSIRAIIATVYRYIKYGKKGGGSTITPQLVRTLFIRNLTQKFRRKIIEILLAFWIEKHFSKTEIINMYISAIRYDLNITGINDGSKYFFGRTGGIYTKAQIFFMIERIGNIRSGVLFNRIRCLLKEACENSQLSYGDINEYVGILRNQWSSGKVQDANGKQLGLLEEAVGKFAH